MQKASNWWKKEDYARKLPRLRMRRRIMQAVRQTFDDMGFDEVETPVLQTSPGLEPHLHAFSTDLYGPDLEKTGTAWLHTSPEFAMKKLLVAGVPKIYQIARVFRNAEDSSLHSPEFTMLEWYRAGADYREVMDDCVTLFRSVARAIECQALRYRDLTCDPFADWEMITLDQAFETYAGFALAPYLEDRTAFAARIREEEIRVAEDDSWKDLFFRVFLERIEPRLGIGRPTIIYNYPRSMAALSRICPDDPRYAERFELYVCGMELANAFGELTDPEEQLRRFEADMDLKERLYGKRYPIDPDFIDALRAGMPEASGSALGIDRFVMLLTGADHIEDVLWSPVRISL